MSYVNAFVDWMRKWSRTYFYALNRWNSVAPKITWFLSIGRMWWQFRNCALMICGKSKFEALFLHFWGINELGFFSLNLIYDMVCQQLCLWNIMYEVQISQIVVSQPIFVHIFPTEIRLTSFGTNDEPLLFCFANTKPRRSHLEFEAINTHTQMPSE